MTYEEDVQYALDELQKEKAVERKTARKEKVATAKKDISKIAKSFDKKIKQPKQYKQLQRGVSKIFEKKKVDTSQLKSARAHELKMAKLRNKQKLAEMKIQADQLAMQQDPRFQQDYMEDQFLGETAPEQPREEYYGPNAPQEGSSRMSFLNNMRLRKAKSGSYFGFNKLRPRNLLSYENNFNKPRELQNKQKLSLMEGQSPSERLRFTTAPSVIKTNPDYKPVKVGFLGNKPTKITVFGKTKL